MNTPVL